MFSKSPTLFTVKTFGSEYQRRHVRMFVVRMKLQGLPAPQRDDWSESQSSWHATEEGDVNTTEKVICSPWIHPSGIQQPEPNLSQHQHIINPQTLLYWKNLMNASLQKQYWNTISDRNILDLQSISFSYAMSTAYHKYNLWSKSGFVFTCVRQSLQKVGMKLKTYCRCSSNMGAFSFLANKSCNKQFCDQVTVIYISATCHVSSAIVIFITKNTMARSLLSACCEHQRCTHWAH